MYLHILRSCAQIPSSLPQLNDVSALKSIIQPRTKYTASTPNATPSLKFAFSPRTNPRRHRGRQNRTASPLKFLRNIHELSVGGIIKLRFVHLAIASVLGLAAIGPDIVAGPAIVLTLGRLLFLQIKWRRHLLHLHARGALQTLKLLEQLRPYRVKTPVWRAQ